MSNGRVCGQNPAVLVRAESCGVVDVHLDQIFVETVIASNPSAKSILEEASIDVDICAYKTRPWFRRSWFWGQEVRFALLG